MIKYYFEKFMYKIGYRKLLFLPSQHHLPMADFYKWVYRPDIEARLYTENDFPFNR